MGVRVKGCTTEVVVYSRDESRTEGTSLLLPGSPVADLYYPSCGLRRSGVDETRRLFPCDLSIPVSLSRSKNTCSKRTRTDPYDILLSEPPNDLSFRLGIVLFEEPECAPGPPSERILERPERRDNVPRNGTSYSFIWTTPFTINRSVSLLTSAQVNVMG